MTTLKINSGEVRLHDDKIIIDDIPASQNVIWFKAFPFAFLVFALYKFSQAIDSKDDSTLFLSVLMGVLFLFLFIMNFKRTNDKEIMLIDIETVKFSKMMWSISAVIRLKNSKRRRIYDFKKGDEIALKKYFSEKNISVTL